MLEVTMFVTFSPAGESKNYSGRGRPAINDENLEGLGIGGDRKSTRLNSSHRR